MAKRTTKKAAKTSPARAKPAASNGVTAELAELRELVMNLGQQMSSLHSDNAALQRELASERTAREAQRQEATAAEVKSDQQLSRLAPLLAQSGIDLSGCPAHPVAKRGCGECREELLIKFMSKMGGGANA